VYGYWNEGGSENIVGMLLYICNRFFADTGFKPPEPQTTPATGCLHPDHSGYFASPGEYMAWYKQHGSLRKTDAPVAAVLLYRKHVITNQMYIPQLVRQMEEEGIIPLPIFINGVEAHTIVRDQLTTAEEKARGRAARDATEVCQLTSWTLLTCAHIAAAVKCRSPF
jgi:magnesium chelatase subunit H